MAIFILFGLYFITQDYDNKYAKYFKDNTPYSLKQFLKKTFFYIPIQIRESKKIRNENIALGKKIFLLKTNNDILNNKLNYGTTQIKRINNKYKIKKIIPPFYDDTNIYKNVKSGFLEIYKDKIIVAFTKGKIVYFDQNFSKRSWCN